MARQWAIHCVSALSRATIQWAAIHEPFRARLSCAGCRAFAACPVAVSCRGSHEPFRHIFWAKWSEISHGISGIFYGFAAAAADDDVMIYWVWALGDQIWCGQLVEPSVLPDNTIDRWIAIMACVWVEWHVYEYKYASAHNKTENTRFSLTLFPWRSRGWLGMWSLDPHSVM